MVSVLTVLVQQTTRMAYLSNGDKQRADNKNLGLTISNGDHVSHGGQ
jgi:hypothetical protein